MRNVGIYRTHKVIQNSLSIEREGIMGGKTEKKNKPSKKNFKAKAVWPIMTQRWPIKSNTPLIDHLLMREFMSGLPSCRSIHKRVRDRKPSLRESSSAVCRFRTEFFE